MAALLHIMLAPGLLQTDLKVSSQHVTVYCDACNSPHGALMVHLAQRCTPLALLTDMWTKPLPMGLPMMLPPLLPTTRAAAAVLSSPKSDKDVECMQAMGCSGCGPSY